MEAPVHVLPTITWSHTSVSTFLDVPEQQCLATRQSAYSATLFLGLLWIMVHADARMAISLIPQIVRKFVETEN